MRILIRLIILTALIVWAYPKLMGFMERREAMKANSIYEKSEKIGRDYQSALNANSDKLMKTLDDLSIQDRGLMRCINQELRRMFGGDAKHAKDLTALLCDRMNISSLSGIGGLSNLKSVSLRDNNITSISPLTNLDKLKAVDLYGNPEIEDFTLLGGLNKLQKVSVSNLRGTYCHEVEEVMEHIKSNKSGFDARISIKDLMRGVRCRGMEVFDVDQLRDKKARGERLTVDEARQLSDYETDQRWR